MLVKGVKYPCQKCTAPTHVANTYWSTERQSIVRERECTQCGYKFWSQEVFLHNAQRKKNEAQT